MNFSVRQPLVFAAVSSDFWQTCNGSERLGEVFFRPKGGQLQICCCSALAASLLPQRQGSDAVTAAADGEPGFASLWSNSVLRRMVMEEGGQRHRGRGVPASVGAEGRQLFVELGE